MLWINTGRIVAMVANQYRVSDWSENDFPSLTMHAARGLVAINYLVDKAIGFLFVPRKWPLQAGVGFPWLRVIIVKGGECIREKLAAIWAFCHSPIIAPNPIRGKA